MMTALDSICVNVEDDGQTVLKKILGDKQPKPWGIHFSMAEVYKGDLKNELLSYGCDPEDIDEAITAVMNGQPYVEYIVGKI